MLFMSLSVHNTNSTISNFTAPTPAQSLVWCSSWAPNFWLAKFSVCYVLLQAVLFVLDFFFIFLVISFLYYVIMRKAIRGLLKKGHVTLAALL